MQLMVIDKLPLFMNLVHSGMQLPSPNLRPGSGITSNLIEVAK